MLLSVCDQLCVLSIKVLSEYVPEGEATGPSAVSPIHIPPGTAGNT